MNRTRSTYEVHAELIVVGRAVSHFDDALAGHPIERRLNRMERVAASFRGRIELRFDMGMLVSFETADAAFLGACEMQHRCAALPQVSGQRLALRVGIHQGVLRQRSRDKADDTREIAKRQAVIEDGVVISGSVFESINRELRMITQPLDDSPIEGPAYRVDWQSEIPSAAYGGESFWPTHYGMQPIGPYLLLHHGLKTVELTIDTPIITVGRDPASDLVLTDIHVSRNHCRIERKANYIMLIDTSTNGTCITTDEGEEQLIKNDSALLKGKGLLFFGRPFNGERRGGVRYETY